MLITLKDNMLIVDGEGATFTGGIRPNLIIEAPDIPTENIVVGGFIFKSVKSIIGNVVIKGEE